MLRTKEQVIQSLNDHFGEEMTYWNLNSRVIWMYQAANGTGKYQNNKNIDYTMHGQIGKPVEKIVLSELEAKYPFMHEALLQHWGASIMEGDDTSVALYIKKGNMWKKDYTKVTAIRKIDGGYELVTFPSFLYDKFIESMHIMEGNSSYNKAVELSGIENPTDHQVAIRMATIEYTSIKDIPDSVVNEIKMDCEITFLTEEQEVEIEGIYTYNGERTNPQKWLWFIDPAEGAVGTASRGNAAGEAIAGKGKFRISSDFRNRDTFIIMNTKDVRIRGYAWYKETDGEMRHVSCDKTIDLSEVLPTYDYYGLTEMQTEAGK